MTFGTGGVAAPFGYLVGVHGVDQVTTGLYTAITDKYKNTATHMALEGAGLSPQAAGLVDCGLSVAGMGAGAWIEANRMATVIPRISGASSTNYGVMHELPKISSSSPTKISVPSTNNQKLTEIEKMLSSYLGKGTKMIKNEAGDLVFLSKDGLRKVRFDFIRPKPHNNPHMHIEELVNDKWHDFRIYPKDVPHN